MDVNRKTALLTLMDVEVKKSYSNLAVNNQIIRQKPNHPAFVRQLVYGVLENKIYLDYLIQHFLNTPLETMKDCERTLLRMGVYQLKFMNSVPTYAAVNETVNLAKRYCPRKEGLVNGVLRNYLRTGNTIRLPERAEDEVRYLSIKYSYAPWIVRLWLDNYESSFVEDLLGAGNQVPDLIIRPNLLKTNREDLKNRLINRGFQAVEGKLAADALHVKGAELLGGRLYKSGMFSVMSESSIYVIEMLDPQPGELIIDVCAAPGGKTLYIAEKMGNRGHVIAQDIYRRKLNIITQETNRLGINIVETKTWDATRLNSTLEGSADRVLVDAPCSGLGVIRRKPEIKYKACDRELRYLPTKQLTILQNAAQYVKTGGILVYGTCTINPAENHRVVFDFLKSNSQFEKEKSIQLLPNVNDTDGFYICRMRKK